MFLTRFVLSKAGWRPRSLGTPGRQWVGKNRRIRHVTKHMRKTQRDKAARVIQVEQMIEFPYLTSEEAVLSEEEKEREETRVGKLNWLRRILGPDVFGLGLGKPSMLDHLMVSDTKRYKF